MRKAIEAVRSLHKETRGWGGCIRAIKTFEAGIPADEDLYDPSLVEDGDLKIGSITRSQGQREFKSDVQYRDVLERCDAPKTIDYFCLVIEGAELEVMKVFPFDVYTFLTLTVERPNTELSNILEENGYTYIMDHGSFGDKLFLHRSAFEELNTAWLNVTAPA